MTMTLKKIISKSIVPALMFTSLAAIAAPQALAQAQWPPFREYESVDHNGVDMITGEVVNIVSDLSGGLPHQFIWRNFLNPHTNFMDNYTGGLGAQRGMDLPHPFKHFRLGNEYIIFKDDNSDGIWEGQRREGLRMTSSGNIWTITLKDGTAITIDTSMPGIHLKAQSQGVVTKVVSPNGQQLDFYYATYNDSGTNRKRLIGVTSNTGYQLDYVYGSHRSYPTSIKSINRAVEYCNPASASACSTTNTWPTVTYTKNTSNVRVQGPSVGDVTLTWSSSSSNFLTAVRSAHASTNVLTYAYTSLGTVHRPTTVTNAGVSATYEYLPGQSYGPPAVNTIYRPDGTQDSLLIHRTDGYAY